MKYTNQILYGEVNIQGLISNNKYLRPATVVMTLPVAVFGFILFSIALVPGRYGFWPLRSISLCKTGENIPPDKLYYRCRWIAYNG